jgi:hypothetical protein
MWIAVELTEGFCYNLRIMGLPLDGPTALFCNNEAVVTNLTAPESTLKKKHDVIAYHRTRQANAAEL